MKNMNWRRVVLLVGLGGTGCLDGVLHVRAQEARAQEAATSGQPTSEPTAEESGGGLLDLVLGLLNESDRDLRALGFEQVRTEAKGEDATRQFAALLVKLPPDGQVGLLSALADRGDRAARPAVLERYENAPDASVKVAAAAALGYLGEAADAGLLVSQLGSSDEALAAAARASLVRLPGEDAPAAIVAQIASQPKDIQVSLIEVLASRRAIGTVPDLLTLAVGKEAAVRRAAMVALSQLASVEHVAGMAKGVLKADRGPEREAAEKALLAVCQRIEPVESQADALLAAMASSSAPDQLALLPALGRVGGTKALKKIEAAIQAKDGKTHDTGIRALCNWPDAKVSDRFVELIQGEQHAEHRRMALRALIRVAVVSDGRSDAERLERLQQAMSLCDRDDERQLVVQRARAVRSVESLRYLLTFIDQARFAQTACESIVELAHHRALRDAHKAEFHAALDQVMQTSKDAVVLDRAQRYKNNQTWTRTSSPSP